MKLPLGRPSNAYGRQTNANAAPIGNTLPALEARDVTIEYVRLAVEALDRPRDRTAEAMGRLQRLCVGPPSGMSS